MSIYGNNIEYIETKDNVLLHIRDWGVGNAIVFIPGLLFGHEMFEYQFTQLPQQGYRCIGISMRGFGKSSKPWGEYSYDVFADDLHTVLMTLDLGNVTLVGFSMGGAIALRYMARYHGDRIANLVLCAAAAPSLTTRSDFPFGLEPGTVDTLIKLCYSDRASLNAELGTLFFKEGSVVTPQLLDWFQYLGMEASPHATVACLERLRDSDLRTDMQSVKIPTVLFHGVHDRICPFELAATMTAPAEAMPAGGEAMSVGGDAMSAGEEPTANGIRGATLVRFENSGHALFYEERVKFNEELINFIKRKSSKDEKYFGPATR
jgi:pimeloyl-ACP methyl ester carboxylesterase